MNTEKIKPEPAPIYFFLETYGCQMNVNDSEILVALMEQKQYRLTEDIDQAHIVFMNTCAVRENAEKRVLGRINHYKQLQKKRPDLMIAVIGCMAERMKETLFEKGVDLVAGPDAYRDVYKLLEQIQHNDTTAINTELSKEETYGDIIPVRVGKHNVSAFISIMRGCDNYCSYCVVPYTRGRERSRDVKSIVNEVDHLIEHGYKEVTLLGQNVNSYAWKDEDGKQINFPVLMDKVAQRSKNLRIRFATSHPKDMSDELLHVIAAYPNICKHIHLPCQSGSSRVLQRMNRKYTRTWYLDRVEAIRKIVPECSITTDIISGFCGETEQDHQETLSLIREVGFDSAFTFRYSVRPGTLAEKKYSDDVPEEAKIKRLNEIISLQQDVSRENNRAMLGREVCVLIEGTSKRSDEHYMGRTSQNKLVVFPKTSQQPGEYVMVKIREVSSATLIGELL